MANVSNIKVKAGNTLVVSGSAVEITGSEVRLQPNSTIKGTALTVSSSILDLAGVQIQLSASAGVKSNDTISAPGIVVGSINGTNNNDIQVQDSVVVTGTLSASQGLTGSVGRFGDLYVNGTISASVMTISETIVSSSVVHHSGSTKFGDEATDTHVFTGSVNISGTVTATSFVGDGSGLTGIPAASLALNQRTVTGSVSVLTDDYALFADTSVNDAAITLTLPAPTTGGRELVIKKVDSTLFAVTLSASAGTIDGENPVDIFGPFQSVTLIANGTDKWFIV